MDKRQQARELWEQSEGILPLKEIAEKLEVAEGTLRSWKKRDGWGSSRCSVAESATQRERQRKRKAQVNRKAAEAIEANDELTDADRDFCLQFIHAPNRVQAAVLTGRYENRNSARQAAFRMMQKPAVQAEIKRLKEIKRSMMLSDTDDLIDFLERAAYTDMNAIADISRNGFELKMGSELDGTIITEVIKLKGGGLKVKRVDPLRAVELLCKIRGDFAPEKHQMGGEISVTSSPRDEINRRIAGVATRIGEEKDS